MEEFALDWQREEKEVQELARHLESLKDAAKQEEERCALATTYLSRAQEAQDILQQLAQAVQQQVHERLAEVVSSCLAAVFDDPYVFKIQFERRRGKTEADLKFVRRGMEVDPMEAAGGGVVDVAAFALRISCMMLLRDRLSPIVVLDEPFRFVSSQYQDAVRSLLEELHQKLGVQIIQITHNERLVTGDVIHLPVD